MPIGGSNFETALALSPEAALDLLARTLQDIGKLKDVDASAGRVKGSIRYGLQRVLVKADVEQVGDGVQVIFGAQGDDIWGAAAKKVLRRWVDAVEASG